MAAVLEVVEGGLLSSVQDLGRPDASALGVPRGGACDSWSFSLANALVGNPAGAAALELTLAGPTLRGTSDCLLGVAGANLEASVLETGSHVGPGNSFVLRAGQTLAFGTAADGRGIRAYLAIAGGFDVPRVFASAATCLSGGFGGHHGRRLQAGDELRARRADRRPARQKRFEADYQPARDAGRQSLRVLPGPHLDRLPAGTLDHLLQAQFRVSPRADRQAIVLEDGAPLGRPDARLLSLPMTWGAIQLPPDGQPICLLADHQTVGGYAVVAVVISADLPLLGQLGPADPVRFRLVTLEEASEALRQQERLWQHVVRDLATDP